MNKFILWDKENKEVYNNGELFTPETALDELRTMFFYDFDDYQAGKTLNETSLEDFDGWELRPAH